MKDKILDYVKEIGWWKWLHRIMVTIFTIYTNVFLMFHYVTTKLHISSDYAGIRTFLFVSSIFSIFGLVAYLSNVVNKRFIFRFFAGYIAYDVTAYVLLAIQNINNKRFHFWNLIGNNFFQTNGLFVTVFIIVLSLIIASYRKRREALFNFEEYSSENSLLCLLLAIVLSNNSQLITYVKGSLRNLLSEETALPFFRAIFTNSIWYLVIFSILAFLVFQSLSSLRHNKTSVSLTVISSFAMAVIFTYFLQLGVRDYGSLFNKFIFPGAMLYSISVLFCIFLMIYTIVNRFVPTTLFIIIIGTVVSIANMLKDSMRKEPLLITDFVWLREINLLLSFLTVKMLISLVAVFLLPVVIYILIRNHVFVDKIYNKIRYRVMVVALILLAFSGLYSVFKNEENSKITNGIPIVSTLNNWSSIEYMGFNVNARYKSLMFVWTKQLTSTIMKTPVGYSENKINKIAKKYVNLAKEINATRTTDIDNQTVIYILSESLSNPNRINGVALSQEILPNIDAIKTKTTAGLMKSDGYGGGTANMEFQTLTGLPFYNFSPSISILYSEVVPKMSVFPSISNAFDSKNRIVMHPSSASNYNRESVYKKLNFNKLLFESGTSQKLQDMVDVGVNPGDESLYNNILDNLDNTKSQFFSVITMQNHAPWSSGTPENITASGEDFTEEENNNLTSYSRLAFSTDSATKDFLNKLSKVKKKITVVFYGDHLPGLYPDRIFSSNPDTQFQTDYFIWSNYQTKKLNYPLVNSSDFTAELLEHTNSRVSPYYALLTQVLKNASVNQSKLNVNQKEIASDLKMIQYDITVGKNYISKTSNFFKMP